MKFIADFQKFTVADEKVGISPCVRFLCGTVYCEHLKLYITDYLSSVYPSKDTELYISLTTYPLCTLVGAQGH